VDPNGGDLVGFSLAPATSLKQVRTTSASAFIYGRELANLHVLTNSRVTKVVFDGKRAVGVETQRGHRGLFMTCLVSDVGRVLTLATDSSGKEGDDSLRGRHRQSAASLALGRRTKRASQWCWDPGR
jgi:hypothetical protein